MFLTYEEAVAWIHARLRLGIKPGLTRMEWMMDRLGHPEENIHSVHIGGTNGKGSTVTFLRSILEEQGYSVGTFTSPYFEQFNERISVNGKPISNDDIVHLVNVIKPLSDELEQTELGGPTEFEVITAMSLYYFGRCNPVDVVLYEVGLGGRFDSTNIISPLLSIITSIGLDHTAILGDTHEKIAFEKAGIIKRDVPIVTAVHQPGALQVIKKKACEENASCFVLGEQFHVMNHQSLANGEKFDWKMDDKEWISLQTTMIGKHQIENASLAIMASLLLNDTIQFVIDPSSIQRGVKKAYWPGRFEVISNAPTVIIDGAHNEEGVHTLVREAKKRYHDKEIHIVFAALRDKKLDGMIQELDEIASQITFVSFNFPRAATSKELYSISMSNNKKENMDWEESVQDKLFHLRENQVLIITGSLYFLAEVKPKLLTLLGAM
ncbi:bifunctional folylpolyglutamate synthase/dihydrofolate synthase [Robertmurraya korlensis]|uniref:bifunctional folylpolyglutamate synthase/dihydrofolate synthase n=1 Tax=Robertmurraya korlensis TaxID=519977 RepID=UPI0008259432|nr:folylpolyglutamate synthase/dihydrofolate synthase family protein [Robertmurraya korlensis]